MKLRKVEHSMQKLLAKKITSINEHGRYASVSPKRSSVAPDLRKETQTF